MTLSSRRFFQCLWIPLLGGPLLFASGCGSEDITTTDPPIPVAGGPGEAEEEEGPDDPTAATGAHQTTISGFEFTVPAGWRQIDLSPEQQGFIDARFEIPEAGEDVSLTLSTVGGGVEANIVRWVGQFSDGSAQETESLTVDGIDVSWVELRGTFQGMGGPFAGGSQAQENWMMIGAAFAGSPQDFYIKLTGPEEAVEDLKSDFRGFVESARLE